MKHNNIVKKNSLSNLCPQTNQFPFPQSKWCYQDADAVYLSRDTQMYKGEGVLCIQRYFYKNDSKL